MKTKGKITLIYDSYILEIVNKEFPEIRKKTYTNSYFLSMFKLMLSDVNSWRALENTKIYPLNSKHHYKYINQKFNIWQKSNVFKRAYINLLHNNYFKLSNIRKTKSLTLFIDTTYIINKYGIESITTHPEYKKKKVTKLSSIADKEKNVLAIVAVPTQISKSGKTKSFPHDVMSVQNTLDNICIDIPKYVNIKHAGDKGYITPKIFNLQGKNISMIAPKRKNQKSKNTKSDIKILSKRYRAENSLCDVKSNNRVMVRKDKKIDTFMGFVFLSLLHTFCRRHNSQ